jgi:hypothetical protein
MALIVITVQDVDGEAQVSVATEPGLPAQPTPDFLLPPAQAAALTMLRALSGEIKEDRGLIQLLS